MIWFMSVIGISCPHCNKENVAAKSVAEHPIPGQSQRKLFTVFFVCGNCHMGIGALVEAHGGQTPNAYPGGLELTASYNVIEVYPKPESIAVPGHLPQNIGGLFFQAADNLRLGHWDASGAMSRKAIEIALGKGPKDNLRDTIDRLAQEGRMTKDMAAWAHEIRILGNEASHDAAFENAEARDALAFAELILMYLFTLPGMLAARRGKTAAPSK